MAKSDKSSPQAARSANAGTPNVLPRPDFHFPGEVGRTYLDSDPAQFPKPVQAPKGAPNILLILIDDCGFGQYGTFGGGIPSPTMDRLASEGLRYNCFHTTALCSPTRAALITGRNHHSAAFAGITEAATGYDGYTCILPRSCGTAGEVLRQNGYMTAWIGKNHNTPTWETSAAGPFDRWANGLGFDYFYGFNAGDMNHWNPILYQTVAVAAPLRTSTLVPRRATPMVVPQGIAGGVPGGVAGGSMGGVIGGVIGGVGAAPPPPAKPSVEAEESAEDSEVTEALSNAEAEAEGTAVGELFEYNLKERITVLKNQSALVPIVQSPIEAEKITLVTAEESGGLSGTPLRALWVRNTSGLTLDGGTFNVLEEDAFAGEGILELLHPGERRLLSYAADKAVRVGRESPAASRTTTRVTILKGVMTVHQEERDATNYIIHNADTTQRQVILEHPIRSGWKLVGEETKPEESSATHYRFRIAVEPGKTEKFSVKESRPEVMRIYLSTLTDPQLAAFVHEGTIKPTVEAELRNTMSKKFDVFNVEQEIKSRQQETELIDKDQARLRENMKALRGSPEEKALLQRYTRELDAQEDRLAGLRKEISDLKGKHAQLQAELDTMVMQIGVDETL